jgi:transposase
MYLRTTRRKRRDGTEAVYYSLAENEWDSEHRRSRVRVVHNFGRAEDLDPEALRRLCRSIARVANGGVDVPEELGGELPEIEIEESRPVGGVHAVRALWEELGIGKLLRGLARAEGAPHETALFAMVANRLFEPTSKRACHREWLRHGTHLPEARELTLDQLYLSMDFLTQHVEEIEERVFFATADLFNADVDLVFYDTTTAYLEVDEEDPGEKGLRRRGHNKEGRDDLPQVVIALAVTRDGLPVRSWVFPGNTVDASTVATIKADLRRWKLGRVILVGDAGMDSEKNRKALSAGLGRYILAMPAGKLAEVQQVLSRPGRFKRVSDSLEVKEVVVGEGERRRRYVVCRNQKEADRRRRHREEILEQLRAELATIDRGGRKHPKRACELLASRRFGRYLSRQGGGGVAIDAKKVAKAERMDGYHVLLTNDDSLEAEDVALGYKAAMLIEACFRRLKTTGLRVRPVYHWAPHRIISHVKLCVLALLIQRAAEIRTGETWRTIAGALETIHAVTYTVDGKRIVQTSKPSPAASKILTSLGVTRPKNVLAVSAAASAA